MNNLIFKVYVNCKTFLECEEGQDLVEYALVVALIAFGAVLGMRGLAQGINSEFNVISSTLSNDI
ncbi:MAG: Flp family type IVb pilin [Terracidiphilus sp.]